MRIHPIIYLLFIAITFAGMVNTDRLRNYLLSDSLSKSQSDLSRLETYTVEELNRLKLQKKDIIKVKGFVVYSCTNCVKKRIVLSDQKVIILKDDNLTIKDVVIYTSKSSSFRPNSYYTLLIKPININGKVSWELVRVLSTNNP